MIPFRRLIIFGPDSNCASGEYRAAALMWPGAEYSGKKKENTPGELWASWPTFACNESSRISFPASTRLSKSIALMKEMIFTIGSLSDPDAGSASKTTVVASRSRTMAATIASRLPYLPSPNVWPSPTYVPSMKALETVSVYLGDGFEIPNLWISLNARKGARLSWWKYVSNTSSVSYATSRGSLTAIFTKWGGFRNVNAGAPLIATVDRTFFKNSFLPRWDTAKMVSLL